MKRDEIEVMDFESEVEVLGVENTEGFILGNEDAFIVDIDDYSSYDCMEVIDIDTPQDDDAL